MAVKMYEKWRMASLDHYDRMFLMVLATVLSGLRGLDYFIGSKSDNTAASWENAFSPTVWGCGFLLASTTLSLSLIFKIHFGMWLGHFFAWLSYGALAVTYYQDAISNFGDGIRAGGPLLFVASVHFVWWLRTGPRSKMPDEEVYAVETTFAPTARKYSNGRNGN